MCSNQCQSVYPKEICHNSVRNAWEKPINITQLYILHRMMLSRLYCWHIYPIIISLTSIRSNLQLLCSTQQPVPPHKKWFTICIANLIVQSGEQLTIRLLYYANCQSNCMVWNRLSAYSYFDLRYETRDRHSNVYRLTNFSERYRGQWQPVGWMYTISLVLVASILIVSRIAVARFFKCSS